MSFISLGVEQFLKKFFNNIFYKIFYTMKINFLYKLLNSKRNNCILMIKKNY